MANKPVIAVIGSLNVDLVSYTPRLPNRGETLTSNGFSVGLGGKGANQAVAVGKLSRTRGAGVSDGEVLVKMVGAVGDDPYGSMVKDGLAKVGVDTSDVRVREGKKTGVAVIVVEEDTGDNRIMFSPEANGTVAAEEFAHGLPNPTPDLVIMQLEIPMGTVTQILETAKRMDVPVLFNPAPAVKIAEEFYPAISHLVVNETEAAILSGYPEELLENEEGRNKVAQRFHDLGAKNVLITLGSHGVYYSVADGSKGHLPAEKVTAVDTTAAGDTFVGAYSLEIVRSKGGEFDIAKAVRFANVAASKSVQKKGAQDSIPWQDEV